MQNKNLKLKLGLCGLALTSFLAVNAHSVVHADTLQNNNAITWDSDSDDSQVVKEEPEQQMAPQSVQKQSTVQASQSQPVQNKKIMVSDVSSVSVSQKRAETSNLRQSNVQTSTVNRLNANNHIAKVDVASASKPVQITNPQNNQIVVHYVKTNGQSAGLADQTVDVTKSGTFSYNVPNGYVLSDPKYTTSETKHDVTITNMLTNAEYKNQDSITNDRLENMIYGVQIISPTTSTYESDNYTEPTKPEESGDSLIQANYFTDVAYLSGKQLKDLGFSDDDLKQSAVHSYESVNNLLDTAHNYPYGRIIAEDVVDGKIISGVGTHAGVADYHVTLHKLADDVRNGVFKYNFVNPSLNEGLSVSDIPGFSTIEGNISTASDLAYWLDEASRDYSSSNDTMGALPFGLIFPVVNSSQYDHTENVHDSYVFQDNSGQVQSVVGNHINVQVTQPVSVNDASQTRKSAERIISVNLPDDQAARDRYKGILNSNSQIVQTINFTRTMIKDALTGATLKQTPWQGPSSFPAVTLPDIPGYTMTMN